MRINSKKIICALDFDDFSRAENFIKAVDYDIVYKVGMEFFYRFGIDGITFPANINTNTGLIEVYEASTQGGKEAQGKMDNSEEYLRQTLSKKYKDMGGFE